MNKKTDQALLEEMGYTTINSTCKYCESWTEVNEKCGYASLCTFNNIGYIEVNGSHGRCNKFKRKEPE